MEKELNEILGLIERYIEKKLSQEVWAPGEDWISYSVPANMSRPLSNC